VILVLGFAATALGLGFALGWKSLKPRLAQAEEDYVFRQQFYEQAKPMAADYPWFGTGPGTFESAFQCYRISSDSVWPAQLHNDWLETRITFGWIGSGLLGLALATLLLRYFAGGAIQGAERLALLIWLGLCGVLVHARFDFPFQVHSIVFLFVVLCAMVSVNRGAELRAIYDL
jgi:O-antigen ligase